MHAIFDLDGTLVDTVPHVTAILNHMLAERGSARRLHVDETRPFISVGGEQMVQAVLGPDCGHPADAIAVFRALYADLPTPADCLFDGVLTGLDRLAAAGITLSICSNKPQKLCEKVVGELGIADRFAAIVGGSPAHTPKPAPDLLEHALAMVGIARRECWFIGDGEPDDAAARAVAIPFVLASYGYADPSYPFEGAARCGTFHEVTDHVLALARRSAWSKAAA